MLIILLIAFAVLGVGCGAEEEPSADLLTLDTVAETFRYEGLRLEVNDAMEPDAYELNGVSPTIYSLGKTDDNLLIYIFDSYIEEDSDELGEFSGMEFHRRTFFARNALIIYLPTTIPEITNQTSVSSEDGREDIFRQEIKRLGQASNVISDIVFQELNEGKVATFLGESQNWQARITLKYWQYHWVNQEGVNKFSGDCTRHHEIKYLGKDIGQVGSVSYKYEGPRLSGSATGLTLDSKGYSSAGSGGSTGWISRAPDKDIYQVTLKWKGQEESLVLTPWEPKAVVDFQ